MDLNYVKKLVKLLSESDVDEIEVEEEGKKVRVAKHAKVYQSVPPGQPPVQYVLPAAGDTKEAGAPVAKQATTASLEPPGPTPSPAAKYHEIKSPIVGTFYRAPAPDAAPFVQVGTAIEPGSVLCIVEAMKLMNEIESDISGTITKVLVENGQPVEYDQTLFLVEKN
jgi:acetyl-CoA carboxylase biotin carboxyl carrier protein